MGPCDLVSEDSSEIYVRRRGPERVSARRIDLRTGQARDVVSEEPLETAANAGGLVPGGRFFWLADPGVAIHDRETCALVASAELRGTRVGGISFCADGSRFAVVTGGESLDEALRARYGPEVASVVRVHETLTCRMLLAVPCPTHADRIVLSTDGRPPECGRRGGSPA